MNDTEKGKKPARKRFKNLSFNRMIPNMLTLMALTAGLTAIRFALDGRWEHATLAIVAAGILDFHAGPRRLPRDAMPCRAVKAGKHGSPNNAAKVLHVSPFPNSRPVCDARNTIPELI